MPVSRRPSTFYRWTRDLHLYVGLFISPFVLLFSVSVFFLNHAKVTIGQPTSIRTVGPVRVPERVDAARGPAAVLLAKDILAQVQVVGEIGSTRFVRSTRHFIFSVSKPGLESIVDLDVGSATVTLSQRKTGVLEALGYLHKMPGPHNVDIRGNWIWTRLWRWFADATIYLSLFISVSGLYLWYALKAERRVGLALLGAGAVSFFGLIYAVIR